MTATVPDAWDECATCGHDREDHTDGTCGVGTFALANGGWWPCACERFTEAPA